MCARARLCVRARAGEDEGPSACGRVCLPKCFLRCERELVIPGLEAARARVHLFLIVSCERARTCVCVRISVCISGRVWVAKEGVECEGVCVSVSVRV